MSDRIILNVVNQDYAHMQRALVNSIRKNAPREKVWAVVADIPKNVAMTVRVSMMEWLLNDYESVAWMDADVLVRDNLDGFWIHNPSAMRVLSRPESGENGRFQTGIMIFGYETRWFLKKWRGVIENELNGEWFADQRGLYLAYERAGPGITHINLPQCFNDWTFQNNSPVWHAKGHYKTRSEKWKNELGKYTGSSK